MWKRSLLPGGPSKGLPSRCAWQCSAMRCLRTAKRRPTLRQNISSALCLNVSSTLWRDCCSMTNACWLLSSALCSGTAPAPWVCRRGARTRAFFLVTDRQALWLRDFTTPGSTFAEGGYIARMVPLERLRSITVLAPGSAPGAFAGRLDASNLPYQRLVLEVEGAGGVELLTIEFPHKAEVEKALARMRAILHAFLPLADGSKDRRLRRLPVVEIWMPQGTEAARLAGLGGIVPAALTERLKQQLAESTRQTGEEILVSVLVPALEGFRTPARLVALTHQALLVIDDDKASRREAKDVPVQRYALSTLSSAQLEYSLLGSGLSLFVPQLDGHTRRLSIPFNSPAIAWFLPLFTRLRLLLSGPYYSK